MTTLPEVLPPTKKERKKPRPHIKKGFRQQTTPMQEEFLAEYIENRGVKFRAARKLGLKYATVMSWFKKKYFLDRFNELEKMFKDGVEDACRARAIAKSDVLGIFFMKAEKPEIYDDNYRKIKWEKEAAEEMLKKYPLPRIQIVSSAPLEKPIDTKDDQ